MYTTTTVFFDGSSISEWNNDSDTSTEFTMLPTTEGPPISSSKYLKRFNVLLFVLFYNKSDLIYMYVAYIIFMYILLKASVLSNCKLKARQRKEI